MKNILIISVIVLAAFSSQAQIVKGNFVGSDFPEKVYLTKQIGDKSKLIDSAEVIDRRFSFPRTTYTRGYYYLGISDSTALQIVLSPREAVADFEIDNAKTFPRNIKVRSSKENQGYYKYMHDIAPVNDQIQEINVQMQIFGKKLKGMTLAKERDQLIQQKSGMLTSHAKQNPQLYLSEVLAAKEVKGKTAEEQTNLYFTPNFFANKDLLGSDVFPQRISDFLQYLTENKTRPYQVSCDFMLQKARVHPEVFDYTLNFLLESFHRMNRKVLFEYLVEKYVVQPDYAEFDMENHIAERVSLYQSLSIGRQAPNIYIPGDDWLLSKVVDESPQNLVFFWETDCDYCHTAIKELKGAIKEKGLSNLQVITVALDNDRSNWESEIKPHTDWVHVSDFKGWDSPFAKNYQVARTPSFFLLDRDMKIRAKSHRLAEVLLSLE